MAEDTTPEQIDSKNRRIKKLSALAIGVFLLLLIAYPSFAPKIKLAYFRATGKGDTIFQNYYSTRPQNALAADSLYASRTAEVSYDTAIGINSFAPNYYPLFQDSSDIIVTKTNTKAGSGVSICPEYGMYYLQFNGDQRNEYAYYQNLYKSVLTAAQGEIIESFLTNKNGSYEYRGGSYAILRELPQETTPPNNELEATGNDKAVSSPGYAGSSNSDAAVVPSDDTVSDTGIEDDVVNSPDTYNLVAVDRINGKDYLVYEYTYEHFCPSDNDSQPQSIPSIQKTWIDPDTYMTVKDILYYERVSDSTMVYEITTTIEHLDPSLSDTYFAFDIQTEIKTIPYVSENDIFTQWLPTTSAHALVPTDEGVWSISGVSSSEAYSVFYTNQTLYMTDRSFYAPGAIGDYYFSIMNNQFDSRPDRMAIESDINNLMSKLDINAYHKDTGVSLYTSMFGGIIEEAALRSQYGFLDGYTVEPATISINGVNVNATKYTSDFEVMYETYPSDQSIEPSPTGYNATMPDRGSYGNYYYHVIFGGNTYYLSLSGESTALQQLSPSTLAFTALSTQNPQDRERITTFLSNTQIHPAPMPIIDPSR